MNHDNPWKYVKVDPATLESNRYLHPTEDHSDDNGDGNGGADVDVKIDGKYILMDRASTYGLGLSALQGAATSPHPKIVLPDGSSVYRPLKFADNLRARIEDFNRLKNADGTDHSLEDRLKFFATWLDSSCGMAYKAKSTKFKIIPVCNELITIKKDFNSHFLSVDYDSLPGTELDSTKHGQKYNTRLTPDEVLENEGWITAVEEDHDLLREYRNIVIAARKENKLSAGNLMGFWVRQNTLEDELRALFVNGLDGDSNAGGGNYLNGNGSFLLVAPQSP